MSPLAWRLLILLIVIALLGFDATRPPPPESWSWVWLGKKLWTMPGGIGAMIGALIGFSVLIWATNKSYKNLIAAQNHKAELDRGLAEEVLHRERTTIYTAIAADLDTLQKSLTGFHDALADPNPTDERNVGKSVLRENRNVIWESIAPKIGLLHPNHAANIAEIYRFIDALTGRVAALNLDNADHRADLMHFTNAATKLIDKVLEGLPIRPDKPSAD